MNSIFLVNYLLLLVVMQPIDVSTQILDTLWFTIYHVTHGIMYTHTLWEYNNHLLNMFTLIKPWSD